MAAAGLLPDARTLAEYCREEASNFRRQYGRPIPIKVLCHNVAAYVHAYTRHGSVRYVSEFWEFLKVKFWIHLDPKHFEGQILNQIFLTQIF